MMKRLTFSVLCVLVPAPMVLADEPAAKEPSGTVDVATIAARQGSLPQQVHAWGTAVAAPDAAQTIGVQTAGQVTRLLVMPGESVKSGQVLFEFGTAPAAVAAYAQASSAVDVAREQRKRVARLLAQQLATRDQLQQAEKAVGDAESALGALRRQQGDRGVLTSKAPYDGIVGSVTANQGDTLPAGAPVLTLDRIDGFVVVVGVEAAALPTIRPGAEVMLQPLDTGIPVEGRVKRVTAAIDSRTRLVDVQIASDTPLLAGAGYRAAIATGESKGWLIPRDAVIGEGDALHVFQVAAGKAVEVPVKIVGETTETSVVDGGLDAALPLVTTGATQLENGMAVRVGAAAGKPER